LCAIERQFDYGLRTGAGTTGPLLDQIGSVDGVEKTTASI